MALGRGNEFGIEIAMSAAGTPCNYEQENQTMNIFNIKGGHAGGNRKINILVFIMNEMEMTWKGNDAEGQWKKSIDLGPQPRVKGKEEKDEKCN